MPLVAWCSYCEGPLRPECAQHEIRARVHDDMEHGEARALVRELRWQGFSHGAIERELRAVRATITDLEPVGATYPVYQLGGTKASRTRVNRARERAYAMTGTLRR